MLLRYPRRVNNKLYFYKSIKRVNGLDLTWGLDVTLSETGNFFSGQISFPIAFARLMGTRELGKSETAEYHERITNLLLWTSV